MKQTFKATIDKKAVEHTIDQNAPCNSGQGNSAMDDFLLDIEIVHIVKRADIYIYMYLYGQILLINSIHSNQSMKGDEFDASSC